MAEAPTPNKATLSELGDTGLKRFGGIIDDEFLRQLKGKKAAQVFREMRDNDDIIGGILFSVEMLLRNVEWRTDPASEDPLDIEIADFVESCRHDMSHSWEDFIAEVLSKLTYGYAPHEICYKQRLGPEQDDPTKRSKHNDGMIGWRKLPIRGQETVERWDYSEDGGLVGMEQRKPMTGEVAKIPMEKLLLFRAGQHKNNPEGRSALRNAFKPWYFKKHISQIEAIGIERDLAGLPKIGVPGSILNPDASAEEKATLAAFKQLGQNIRNDEQSCVIYPLEYDEKGNEIYKVELMSSSGARQFDTNAIISRYDKRIAGTLLADFIMLGQDGVGSLALSSDKTELFATALGAWLKSIAEVMNRFAIPRLLRLNAIPLERAPRFVPGDIEKPDIEKFAQALSQSVLAGVLGPDEGSDKLRQLLDLPRIEEE